jgi:hypothetical protein
VNFLHIGAEHHRMIVLAFVPGLFDFSFVAEQDGGPVGTQQLQCNVRRKLAIPGGGQLCFLASKVVIHHYFSA